MLMMIFLSCTKSKRNEKCKAKDMYISDLFKKSLQYAESLKPDKIFILSAKYGLLNLDDIIAPYNQTLKGANNETCKHWAMMVYKQMLEQKIDFAEKAIFLCGVNYRRYLMTKFKNASAPMKNIRIGKQLEFYTKNLK